MYNEGNIIFKGLSIASFVSASITLCLGFDKMLSYKNSEWGHSHNAYVGGDAYNYIINGNYATGFFVLTAALALMGIGFIALWYLSKMYDLQENMGKSCSMIENCTQKIEQNTYPDEKTTGDTVEE